MEWLVVMVVNIAYGDNYTLHVAFSFVCPMASNRAIPNMTYETYLLILCTNDARGAQATGCM